MNQPEHTDPLAALLQNAAELDEQGEKRARAAFLERVERDLPSEGRFGRGAWLIPLAAAALALVLFVWPSSSLSYAVAGAKEDGGYIRAAGAPATLHFSDATEVVAQPEARVRIVETTAHGARVSLEQGELSVHVTHTEQSAWNFVAGPFDVRVTGTRFLLAWDPQMEQLRVDLFEGSVEIAGYDDSGPMAVKGGQRFLGDAKLRTMHVSRLSEEPDGAQVKASAVSGKQSEPQPTALPPVPAQGDSQGTAGDAGKKAASGAADWSSLVSKGKFQAVVQAAESRGISSCLSGCSATDLGALADAARYTGQNALAEKSLKALRSRFSGSSGPRAAFLLGRLYEGQGQSAQARRWYETSLSESPSGAYSGEALAGKMRAVLGDQGRAAARSVALEYLKRYPQGVHAAAATKIAQP